MTLTATNSPVSHATAASAAAGAAATAAATAAGAALPLLLLLLLLMLLLHPLLLALSSSLLLVLLLLLLLPCAQGGLQVLTAAWSLYSFTRMGAVEPKVRLRDSGFVGPSSRSGLVKLTPNSAS
jgi:hypothetical protein